MGTGYFTKSANEPIPKRLERRIQAAEAVRVDTLGDIGAKLDATTGSDRSRVAHSVPEQLLVYKSIALFGNGEPPTPDGAEERILVD